MKILGSTCHVLAAIALVAAIWSPVGAWWQFLATALILFLAGAMILGQESQRTAKYAQGGQLGPQNDDDCVRIPLSSPITTDDVADYKRTYGKKAKR